MAKLLLLSPTRLGSLSLKNHIVMAPMTRSRATADGVPTDLMKEYYVQRASAGMIITEGVSPSAEGIGYCRTPGIFTAEQVEAWGTLVDAVHAAKGTMVMQLMHCGRVGHPNNKAPDVETIAPSAIAANVNVFTEDGFMPAADPRELTTDEVSSVVQEYAQAASHAMEAGFDGVELHCTSGYLPAQFLSTGTNRRTDKYGGSLENRLRFVIEVIDSLIDVCGASRVGIRICPGNPFNDLTDDNPEETFEALLSKISDKGLAYLHVIRLTGENIDVMDMASRCFKGSVIINESFNAEEANNFLEEKKVKAVSFGRPFIANPDFVKRIEKGYPLDDFDAETLYTPGAKGYTTYRHFIENKEE